MIDDKTELGRSRGPWRVVWLGRPLIAATLPPQGAKGWTGRTLRPKAGQGLGGSHHLVRPTSSRAPSCDRRPGEGRGRTGVRNPRSNRSEGKTRALRIGTVIRERRRTREVSSWNPASPDSLETPPQPKIDGGPLRIGVCGKETLRKPPSSREKTLGRALSRASTSTCLAQNSWQSTPAWRAARLSPGRPRIMGKATARDTGWLTGGLLLKGRAASVWK